MPPRAKRRANGKAGKKKPAKWEAQAFVLVQNLQLHVEDDMRWTKADVVESLQTLENNLAKMRAIQRPGPKDDDPLIPSRTEKDFETFNEWLQEEHAIDLAALRLRIARVADGTDNFSLLATEDIAAGSHLVSIPEEAMLSTAELEPMGLGPILRVAPELARVPSVLLSLILLIQALDPESLFYPYIRTLPRTFTTPFSMFAACHFSALRPSPAFDRSVNTMRGLVRRYARVYTALRELELPCLPVVEFSFARYMWAVSVVMTRQNEIPTEPRSLALVPVWDMCNHSPGTNTTSVVINPETETVTVDCDAMRTFKEGDAITIFYGRRQNSELLLFSGFLQKDNIYDKVSIPLVLRKTDPLCSMKLRIMEKAKVVAMPQKDPSNEPDSKPVPLKLPETDPLSAFKRRILDKSRVIIPPETEPADMWLIKVIARSDGSLGDDGLALARVISMDKDTLLEFLHTRNKLPIKPLSDTNAENKALKLVWEASKTVADRYDSFVGEDEVPLPSTCCPKQMELIAQLLDEERALLQRVLTVHQGE